MKIIGEAIGIEGLGLFYIREVRKLPWVVLVHLEVFQSARGTPDRLSPVSRSVVLINSDKE